MYIYIYIYMYICINICNPYLGLINVPPLISFSLKTTFSQFIYNQKGQK